MEFSSYIVICKTERFLYFEFSFQNPQNMYPWYRDSVGGQLGQLCGPMATTIKTENGYNDCMLALDYATQSKVSPFNFFGATVTITIRETDIPDFICVPQFYNFRSFTSVNKKLQNPEKLSCNGLRIKNWIFNRCYSEGNSLWLL